MSAPFFKDDIEFLQRFLKSGGFYRDELDGEWGPNTEEAMTAFDAASTAIRQEMGELDSRSEQKIRTLHLPVQRAARRALQSLAAAGITAKIISGTRTYAEQDALFEIGRSKPGDRVTNARGGESNHNLGSRGTSASGSTASTMGNGLRPTRPSRRGPMINTRARLRQSSGCRSPAWSGEAIGRVSKISRTTSLPAV